MRGQLDFHLNQDPPPDLVLEIDITSKSLNRFPICVRLGVPELWCYDDGALKIYHLNQDRYEEAEQSLAFPRLNVQELPQLIENYRSAGKLTFRQAVRAWVKAQFKD